MLKVSLFSCVTNSWWILAFCWLHVCVLSQSQISEALFWKITPKLLATMSTILFVSIPRFDRLRQHLYEKCWKRCRRLWRKSQTSHRLSYRWQTECPARGAERIHLCIVPNNYEPIMHVYTKDLQQIDSEYQPPTARVESRGLCACNDVKETRSPVKWILNIKFWRESADVRINVCVIRNVRMIFHWDFVVLVVWKCSCESKYFLWNFAGIKILLEFDVAWSLFEL